MRSSACAACAVAPGLDQAVDERRVGRDERRREPVRAAGERQAVGEPCRESAIVAWPVIAATLRGSTRERRLEGALGLVEEAGSPVSRARW